MSAEAEFVETVEKLGTAFEGFKSHYDDQLATIERKVNGLKLQPANNEFASTAPASFYDAKTRRAVPVLSHKHRLAALPDNQPPNEMKTLPSIGRVLRGLVLGGKADDWKELAEERKALSISDDATGGYTVDHALSSVWIDKLRAQMVLSQAGAVTIPMDANSLRLAKVTGDPTVSWHQENGTISDSEVTFGSVNLQSKTVVCLVKLSLELAQDAANIDTILGSTLTNALAGAIDSAGLMGVTSNSAAAPGGVVNMSGRNRVTAIGALQSWDFAVDGIFELMNDNVALNDVGPLVAHPGVWKAMRKIRTGISGDMTVLTAPDEVAALQKLWTTAAPLAGNVATGVIADWRDLIFGIRKQITVKVISETFLGTNLQVGVLAYARCDFGAAREQSFCTLEGIVV